MGQLGMGDGKASKSFLTFTKINHLSSIVDIAAGDNHSICCTAAGRVVTFGHPSNGQLGHGTNGNMLCMNESVSSFLFFPTLYILPTSTCQGNISAREAVVLLCNLTV